MQLFTIDVDLNYAACWDPITRMAY
jgi:hypothetical protein